MIKCKKCKFSVSDTMKHSLKQNACPSCGKELFSHEDTNMMAMIRSSLAKHRFSRALPEDIFYDVTLFAFNEIKSGVGSKYIDEMVKEATRDMEAKTERAPDEEDNELDETISEYSEDEEVGPEIDHEELKREIEQEYRKQLESLDEAPAHYEEPAPSRPIKRSDEAGEKVNYSAILDDDGDIIMTDDEKKAERLREVYNRQRQTSARASRAGFRVKRLDG